MSLRTERLEGTTAVGGALTVTGDHSINGYLEAVEWIDGTFSDGVDAVLSVTTTPSGVDRTLLTLTNANNDAWYQPRELAHDNTGATLPQGADKTAIYARPRIVGTLKLAVTAGGDGKTGGCIVHWDKNK